MTERCCPELYIGILDPPQAWPCLLLAFGRITLVLHGNDLGYIIKCFDDYLTMVDWSAFLFLSNLDERRCSKIGKPVILLMSMREDREEAHH